MSLKRLFFFSLIFIILYSTVFSNPYGNNSTDTKDNNSVFKIPFMQKISQWNITFQKDYRQKITSMLRRLRKEKDNKLILSILLVAFIYGILHSLGPGHGKFILSSLVLTGKHKFLKSLSAGYFMGMLHSLSAMVVILTLYFTLKSQIFSHFSDTEKYMRVITSGLIIVIGVWNLLLNEKTHNNNKNVNKDIGFYNIIFTAGIVPCPATSLVLLFSINLKIIYVGILCALIMGLGMGTGISLSTTLTYFARDSFFKIFKKVNGSRSIENMVHRAGFIFIILSGIFLLYNSI